MSVGRCGLSLITPRVIQMPCDDCGESAMEKHGGWVGGNLRKDEDGVVRYVCLDCTIDRLKEMSDD